MSGISANSCRVTPSRSVTNSESVEAPVRRMKFRRVSMTRLPSRRHVRRVVIDAVLDAALEPRTVAQESEQRAGDRSFRLPLDRRKFVGRRPRRQTVCLFQIAAAAQCVRVSTRKAGESFTAAGLFLHSNLPSTGSRPRRNHSVTSSVGPFASTALWSAPSGQASPRLWPGRFPTTPAFVPRHRHYAPRLHNPHRKPMWMADEEADCVSLPTS